MKGVRGFIAGASTSSAALAGYRLYSKRDHRLSARRTDSEISTPTASHLLCNDGKPSPTDMSPSPAVDLKCSSGEIVSTNTESESQNVSSNTAASFPIESFIERTSDLEQCRSDSMSLNSYLPTDIRTHFNEKPMRQQELQAAFNELESHPDIIYELCPESSSIQRNTLNIVFDRVQKLLKNEHILESVTNRIFEVQHDIAFQSSVPDITEEFCTNDEMDEIQFDEIERDYDVIHGPKYKFENTFNRTSVSSPRTSPNKKWNDLRSGNRICAICQDVLAKPVTTNCTHSFCGICLETHIKSVQAESDDIEVVHLCPVCREPIIHYPFCGAFSDDILQLVSEVENCPEKSYWQERYDSYEKILHDQMMARKSGKKPQPGNSEAQWNLSSVATSLVLAAFIIICVYKARVRVF